MMFLVTLSPPSEPPKPGATSTEAFRHHLHLAMARHCLEWVGVDDGGRLWAALRAPDREALQRDLERAALPGQHTVRIRPLRLFETRPMTAAAREG
jgi:hypothetical protein